VLGFSFEVTAPEMRSWMCNNADWIDRQLLGKAKLEDFRYETFDAVNHRLIGLVSRRPIVSVVIAAYNEEANIVRCIDSLSKNDTKYPIEIIVVDNNSSDRTHEAVNRFMVRYAHQPIQGCGAARQLGQEVARGKYILTADADALYPPQWIDEMMEELTQPGVACVYGMHSFLSDEQTPRWKLAIYEWLGGLLTAARSFKRPYLNAHGMTMGYVRELGMKVGYTTANVRGEDGRLAFDLMKYGKIVRVKSFASRVWTGTRTLSKDGTLWEAVRNRVVMALANLSDFFTRQPDHDTKNSPSSNYDYQHNLSKIKHSLGLGRHKRRMA
jgi:glycosyltransferase involved in cell wall biosynthesis